MRILLGAHAIVLAVAATLAAASLAAASSEPARMDFAAQYAAARLVLDGRGAAILDPAAIQAEEQASARGRVALLPFVQPPAVALILSPVALLPYERAFAVLAALDALLIALSLGMLRGDGWGRALLLVAPPSAFAIAQGQLTPLVLLFVVAALRAGPRIGGLALGLSLLRPQTAPLLLLAALLDPRRRWWAFGGATAVVATSAVVVGIDGLVRYGDALAQASGWSVTGELGLRGSIGWPGLTLLAGWGGLGVALSVVSLIAGAVAVARAPVGDRPAVAALWSLLGGVHLLIHDAVLAYPAVLALASRRSAWDAASVVSWMVHVLVAPVGVLWTLTLALAPVASARSRGAAAPRPVTSSVT